MPASGSRGSDEGAGRVVLRAAEWTSKSDNRTAVFTIHVGTADTSEASAEIAVVQLRVDDYYYLYGASVPRYEAIDAALQMTKQEEGVYTAETYFAADGTNPVRINKDSRTASYPCYVLAAGGTVAEIASAEAPLPAGPEIDADGLRMLTVDFNRMTWQWERITTPNCLPDDRVADYPTKAYVTPRGTYKTWMTRNLDWDGGDGIGVYKLGCPLVFSATNKDTGGYNSKTDPTYSYRNTAVRNPAWDDTGNGGELEPDAAITALGGRHYTFYEYLTGAPRGGLMEEYYSEWPAPYTVGREVRDAADYTILFEGLTSAKLQEYAGREEEFFEEHPVSRIQIQGICPYGWHVANFQDWYDILYAAYDFGSKNNGGYVPKEPSFANTVYGSSSAAYKINVVPYLRISRALWTVGGKCLWDEAGSLYPVNEGSTTKSPAQADIADNSEEFGFNLAPTGWRAMSGGMAGSGVEDPCMDSDAHDGDLYRQRPYLLHGVAFGGDDQQRQLDLPRQLSERQRRARCTLREELRRGVIRRRSGRERAEHPLPDPSLLGKGGAATENDFKPKQNNETIPIFIDLRGCGDGRLYGGAARFRHDACGAACAGGAVRRPDQPAGEHRRGASRRCDRVGASRQLAGGAEIRPRPESLCRGVRTSTPRPTTA